MFNVQPGCAGNVRFMSRSAARDRVASPPATTHAKKKSRDARIRQSRLFVTRSSPASASEGVNLRRRFARVALNDAPLKGAHDNSTATRTQLQQRSAAVHGAGQFAVTVI